MSDTSKANGKETETGMAGISKLMLYPSWAKSIPWILSNEGGVISKYELSKLLDKYNYFKP